MRIKGTAIRGRVVSIKIGGKSATCYEGENVAAALLASGILRLRTSPTGDPRGMFCVMGACQECVVDIDGRTVAACQIPVADGMEITLRSFTDSDH